MTRHMTPSHTAPSSSTSHRVAGARFKPTGPHTALLAVLLAAMLATGVAPSSAAPALPKDKLPEAAALAYETAAGLTNISAQLANNQKEVSAMIARRTDAVVARERLAASNQDTADEEIEMFRMTRGAGLSDSLRALMRRAERKALEPAELDALEAALRADMKASTTLPAMSNEKLDAAAKKLARLAEQPSQLERTKEFLGFFKETKKAVEKLTAEAQAQQAKGAQETPVDTPAK